MVERHGSSIGHIFNQLKARGRRSQLDCSWMLTKNHIWRFGSNLEGIFIGLKPLVTSQTTTETNAYQQIIVTTTIPVNQFGANPAHSCLVGGRDIGIPCLQKHDGMLPP